jgi:hypothetical protein
LKTNKSYW